ncbi:unnamed protein product [Wuchereria bancrofti]|uniref:Uncharacterized protein n=1 Tax=Wuchereria bancrofti TaxID=6293 RepID=A0A3P7EN38_WUCBA|nr:unnamed protein product [Wuchereria bancrofti]
MPSVKQEIHVCCHQAITIFYPEINAQGVIHILANYISGLELLFTLALGRLNSRKHKIRPSNSIISSLLVLRFSSEAKRGSRSLPQLNYLLISTQCWIAESTESRAPRRM